MRGAQAPSEATAIVRSSALGRSRLPARCSEVHGFGVLPPGKLRVWPVALTRGDQELRRHGPAPTKQSCGWRRVRIASEPVAGSRNCEERGMSRTSAFAIEAVSYCTTPLDGMEDRLAVDRR